MKRKLALMLALMLMAAAFSGCAGDKAATPPSEAEPAEQEGAEEQGEGAVPKGIGLTGVVNARDMGGYATLDGTVVKSGLILRSGELMEATEEDIRILTEDYNLGIIVDLRGPITRAADPNPGIAGTASYAYDVMGSETRQLAEEAAAAAEAEQSEEAPEEPAEVQEAAEETETETEATEEKIQSMWLGAVISFQESGTDVASFFRDSLYTDLVTSAIANEGYQGVFKALLEAEEGAAVLFHCTAGKDRTGVGAALILSALNVDREIIYADFMLTNDFTAATIEERVADAAKETDDEYLLQEVRLLTAVDPAYLDVVFEIIDNQYGGIDKYLTEVIGLTEEDIAALRAKYTE
jgi:Protein tyrosine/serine phosphatase